MRSGKHIRSTHFRSIVRLFASLVLLLSLVGNSLVLAMPQARRNPEPATSPNPLRPWSPSVMDEPEFTSSVGAAAAPTIHDARALPDDLAGLPELVDRRTANSATFQVAKSRYATIVDAGALHYQDGQGAWQVIDPTFRPDENSFVVEYNSIRSRAGLYAARLSASVNETIIIWQATVLGAVTGQDGSRFVSLARALAESASFAEQRQQGRTLHYAHNWSDPSLAEEIVSTPGSLEHLLILSEAPTAAENRGFGDPEFLEMRATLRLLTGAELWAEGQAQSGAFQTAGGLEIRDAEGATALVFDPVLAFEQARPDIAVEGTYTARPGEEPGTWTIGLRTPWSWWTDHGRQYPAVIDPTMHVLRSTGYESGIAWVANGASGNPDATDGSLHFGEMVLGSWAGSGPYSGYVQFNSIPHMLTNAPVSIKAAYLDIEPAQVRMPYYSWSGQDWEKYPTQHDATVYDLGQCPGGCGGFSLTDNPLGFDWSNVPQGTPVANGTLVGPAPKGTGKTEVTGFDVTSIIQAWNQQSPRPDDGPLFRLTVNSNCYWSTFTNLFGAFVPECTRLVVPAGSARLRIEYGELPIAVGQSFLNDPGVPSFYENVFEEGTTNHQYELAIPVGDDHWRAAAVRGNHALDAALPTRTGLKLVDHGAPEPVDLVNGTVQEADRTAVVLIDEHNPDNLIEVADLRVEVTASNDNDFPTDEGRNYRIEHQRATAWSVPYSAWHTQTISFPTDRLIKLSEFELDEGDTVLILVSAPITFPLTIGLAAPTIGTDKADSALGNVQLQKGFAPEGKPLQSKGFTVKTAGVWALALINEGRPVPDPNPLTGPAVVHQVSVEMLRCPQGTIPTDKWVCQPVILPRPDTPRAETELGLTVYSEGGFDGDPNSDTWCTTSEGDGTPIIGPDVDGRWVVVGQGSVCRNGDVISTTADSGVGLAIAIPNPNPFPDGTTRGQLPPSFVYGSTALSPLPPDYPTGVVVWAGEVAELQPQEDTLRVLAPFDEYWGPVFTPGDDAISITDMMAHGGGIINTAVTVDAATSPQNVDWDVAWALYPEEVAEYDYLFEAQAAQSPALHAPSSSIDLASLQLRILDLGNAATGTIEGLDAYILETAVSAGQLRAARARITQDVDLGGASKDIQVVVQPPGFARLPANEKSCSHLGAATSCLDLRRDDYGWDNGNGDKNVQPWELPDMHIEDSAGTVMLSRPGDLQIFSADHPDAADMAQSFSFDTWGASVSIKEEACTSGGPVVTVVRGTANIALPSIGDDGSGGSGGILVGFKLCQAKLYQAKITLSLPPPGIPVGSTGVGVNLIGGEVTVDPDFTQVELQVGFQTLDGGTITGGNGSVLIDTRGLFQLQASALIVGIVDAELLLQVAWDPLDVLLEAGVSCCGGLISGGLYMHAWLGQGWQDKYSWLPPNDDFHFAGSIHATLTIPEGYIGDVGIAELPPFEFSRSLTISFGEFCTNSSCTDYAWGMSVVFSIVGIDVGLYVDEANGPEFILGTDSHVLIDQFGGTSRQSTDQPRLPAAPPPYEIVQPGSFQRYLAKPFKTPVDDWEIKPAEFCEGIGTSVQTCPITVTAGAGRALFTVAWENGALDVSLIKPDLTIITPANAASHNVIISETSTLLANQVSFGVPQPAIMSGVWKVKMGNVIADPNAPFQTNYQILYAAEPPPPTLTWNSPASAGTTPDPDAIATLDWTALRASQPLTPGTQIELFYTPIDQKPVTPTLMTGTLIVNRIPANPGTYAWDTNGLASGEYAVGGRIDDRVNANGHIVAWAPGTIVVNDTTPPPVPIIVGKIEPDDGDALIVTWMRDNLTPDLAGYLVQYTIPDWSISAPQLDRVRRTLPHPPGLWPWFERIRLGGLLGGQPTTVCVRAYDASGNVSECVPFTHVVDRRPESTLGPPQRITALGGRDPLAGETRLRVDWLAPEASTGTPAGYALSYSLAGCVLPGASSLAGQGPSPIDVGNVLSYELTGLTVGQTYRLAVNGYMTNGYFGPEAATYALFIDPADNNSDGLPDQWAGLYNLTGGAADDPDGDGLTNGQELILMSNPLHADSDQDGYYDGEEDDWGTDLCGPEQPPYHSSPKLTLVGSSELEFKAASNQKTVGTQELVVHNLGGGTLDWSATASEPWIMLGSEAGSGPSALSIGVDPQGLSAGLYTGTITFVNLSTRAAAGPSQAAARQEVATLDVSLEVLPPKRGFGYTVYLPLIFR